MMNLQLYNKLFYLIIVYRFFELSICAVHSCITYVCAACVVTACLIMCVAMLLA